MINLNSSATWFHSDELEAQAQLNDGKTMIYCKFYCNLLYNNFIAGYATVIPRHELMNVRAVTQLERDTILVCYDSKSKFHIGEI